MYCALNSTRAGDTSTEGHLTGRRILDTVDGNVRGLSVFLCGPDAMVRSLQAQLRAGGLAASRMHQEYFDWR